MPLLVVMYARIALLHAIGGFGQKVSHVGFLRAVIGGEGVVTSWGYPNKGAVMPK